MFNSTKSVARLARKPIASCSFSNSSFRSNEPTASTSTAESTPPTETPTPEVKVEAEPVYDVGKNDKGFKAWLSGEGARYRKGVSGGTNWLGETVSSDSNSISLSY